MEEEKSTKSTEETYVYGALGTMCYYHFFAVLRGQDEQRIEQLIASGRRCLACGDVTNASTALQQACELL